MSRKLYVLLLCHPKFFRILEKYSVIILKFFEIFLLKQLTTTTLFDIIHRHCL